MATLHLELDIDSDVHPELYVRLASIERSPARQEKLRQLAATGLIWEIARLHGPAFSEPERVTQAPPRPHELGEIEMAPASRPAVEAGAVGDHAPRVPEDVPLLVDIVDDAELGPDDGMGGALDPAAPAAVDEARVARLAEMLGAPASAGAPAEAAGARTRSARIRRMKESGLFQNG